jgi:hypothetical protein
MGIWLLFSIIHFAMGVPVDLLILTSREFQERPLREMDELVHLYAATVSGSQGFLEIELVRFDCGVVALKPVTPQAAGRDNPRLSRSVVPSYPRRNNARRCNSGTTSRTNSSSPPGI